MTGQTSSPSLGFDEDINRMGRRLVDDIEDRILSGDLSPGSRLPSERQLAESTGLSRPMVREALRALAARGYVEVMPGRGAFVRDVSVGDVARPLERLYWRRSTPREVVEARRMLESQAAALAAERATDDDLAAMANAIAVFDRSSDPILRARYDLAFHLAMVRAAHNPVIEAMFCGITRLTVELMVRSLSDPTVARAGVPFHQHILAAVRARDAEAARAAVVGHLQVAAQHYGTDFDAPLDDVARREARRVSGSTISLDELLASLAGQPDDPPGPVMA